MPVDNSDPARTRVEGEWPLSTEPASFYGRDFAYTTAGTDERVFRWRLTAPRAGRYAVQACWAVSPEFATAAPFTISVDGRQVAEATADLVCRNAYRERALDQRPIHIRSDRRSRRFFARSHGGRE